MIQDILDELTIKDYPQISKDLECFIKNQVTVTNRQGVILGLSGGIDSAVLAVLAKNAFPKNTLVLIMPDGKISPKQETEDALELINKLGLDYKLLDINLLVNEFTKILEPDQKSAGNLRARIRSNILYYYANLKNYLVLGSSDKSEYLIGYFTKYGDGAADTLPLVSLYKTQIRKLAQYLEIPQSIIEKKSSPNLWPGHDAEGEIGATYQEIDSILYCMTHHKQSIKDAQKTLNIPTEKIKKIYQMHQNSKHKRELATKAPDIK